VPEPITSAAHQAVSRLGGGGSSTRRESKSYG
jgi:hypothetical protein